MTSILVFTRNLENLILLKLDYGELDFPCNYIHEIYAWLHSKLGYQEPVSSAKFALMAGEAAALLVLFL